MAGPRAHPWSAPVPEGQDPRLRRLGPLVPGRGGEAALHGARSQDAAEARPPRAGVSHPRADPGLPTARWSVQRAPAAGSGPRGAGPRPPSQPSPQRVSGRSPGGPGSGVRRVAVPWLPVSSHLAGRAGAGRATGGGQRPGRGAGPCAPAGPHGREEDEDVALARPPDLPFLRGDGGRPARHAVAVCPRRCGLRACSATGPCVLRGPAWGMRPRVRGSRRLPPRGPGSDGAGPRPGLGRDPRGRPPAPPTLRIQRLVPRCDPGSRRLLDRHSGSWGSLGRPTPCSLPVTRVWA